MKPLAIFRADASSRIGGGHVMRCLTLANALSTKAWKTKFACNKAAVSVVPKLLEQDLYSEADDFIDAAALKRRWPDGCDLLVVDHYGLAVDFESSCRGWSKRIVVLDDLADRPHDCDILIDATFRRRDASYATLVSPTATMLLGSAYALLRPEFAAMREHSIARRAGRSEVERVFISLGLTDLDGITEQAVNALLMFPGDFRVDVVTTKSAQSWAPLAKIAKRERRLVLHDNPANIASIMGEADFAIGAGGTTSWERCALGLPTVLLVLADNQRMVADQLEKAAAAIVVSPSLFADTADFEDAVARLTHDRDLRLSMSANAAAITDGAGAERVTRAILQETDWQPSTVDDNISLRRATLDDSLLIWAWRNDAESRENSKQARPILWTDHSQWFRSALNDGEKFIFVASAAEDPCGMVRFDKTSSTKIVVSIVVAPHRRGISLGTALLRKGCSLATQMMPETGVWAEIKVSNVASQRTFEACGFLPVRSENGMLSYLFDASAGTDRLGKTSSVHG